MSEQNFGTLQFYQVFMDQNNIDCCQSNNCCLCKGKQFAIITEEDHEMIGNMIFNRLRLRMKEIKEKIKTVNNIDQFLLHHLNKKFPYQMKVIKQSQITQKQQQQIAEFTIKYKNSGDKNWPQQTYLQCKTKPFENIKCKVQSLSQNQECDQVISFVLPEQQMNKTELKWQLMHQIYEIDHFFGPIIVIEIEGSALKQKLDFQIEQDFHKENMFLFEKIKDKYYDFIKLNEAPQILFQHKNKKLNGHQILDFLWKE